VVYLATFQFVPEDRLATLMQDLFGVSLARATIGQMSRRAGQRLLDFAAAVRQLILSAPVKHFDETGFRIPGSSPIGAKISAPSADTAAFSASAHANVV
jgi:transposase